MRFPWSRRAPGARRHPRPSWAVFLSEPAWEAFLQTLELELAEQGCEATGAGDVLEVRTDASEMPLRIGLRPLAQRCAAVEEARWPEVISAHLEGLFRGRRELHTLARGDFAAVRERLRLRLYPEEVLASEPVVRLVHQRVATGVIAALAMDSPNALASVPAEDFEAWGEPLEEVWGLAREQTREVPELRERVGIARDLFFEAHQGPSFLVASQVLFLPEDRGGVDTEPFGRLVAVPTCHLLLSHAIRDARVLLAVQAMGAQALLSFHHGPGSLSPHLYWLSARSEELMLLPTEVHRKGLAFRPPDAFVEQVMVPLGADDAAP